MKQHMKWKLFVIVGLIVVVLSGCKEQPVKQQVPSTQPTLDTNKSNEEANNKESIYNYAFEAYSDVTELGVIINQPKAEDLEKLTVIDTFGNKKEEPMLIIPKYNGSKITVNSVEYTGEQYIAKEELFSKDCTPAGYGLELYTIRPEGIPTLMVTINYEKMVCKYVILSNGKDGDEGIEYLKIETETAHQAEGDLVLPVEDATYLNGLKCFSSTEVDIDKDGANEKVEVYCDGEISGSGDYQLDDGQTWALVVRKGDKIYPLFDKAYIQLGNLQYSVYQDYNDYDKVHIIVEYKTGTAIYYYDCTLDDETGDIRRNNFFGADNINLIKTWR